jgi:hypothetical protein
MPQVSCLLHPAPVRADQVGKTEIPGHDPDPLVGTVVEDVGGGHARVGADEFQDVHPRVVQHRQRLTTDRQEDIEGWITGRPP